MPHEAMSVPACQECAEIRYSNHINSIWLLRDHIKHTLITKYAKHLGIGENWTEQELAEYNFTGALLGGFGRSAWEMYQIAKDRVSFKGWPITLDEMPIDAFDEASHFTYGGTRFISLGACIEYYVKAAGVDRELLDQLVDIVSAKRFSYALRVAKLNKSVSNKAREEIVAEIQQQEIEQQEVAVINAQNQSFIDSNISDVTVSGTKAPAFAIQWALQQNIRDLATLCAHEDDYFDHFESLGGTAAFMSYNGLQLYFEARENPTFQANDPNQTLWDALN